VLRKYQLRLGFAVVAMFSQFPIPIASLAMVQTMLVSSFPPAIKNNWYDARVVIAGEVPDSLKTTESVPPPGSVAPAAGDVNKTSPSASDAKEVRRVTTGKRMVLESASDALKCM